MAKKKKKAAIRPPRLQVDIEFERRFANLGQLFPELNDGQQGSLSLPRAEHIYQGWLYQPFPERVNVSANSGETEQLRSVAIKANGHVWTMPLKSWAAEALDKGEPLRVRCSTVGRQVIYHTCVKGKFKGNGKGSTLASKIGKREQWKRTSKKVAAFLLDKLGIPSLKKKRYVVYKCAAYRVLLDIYEDVFTDASKTTPLQIVEIEYTDEFTVDFAKQPRIPLPGVWVEVTGTPGWSQRYLAKHKFPAVSIVLGAAKAN